MTDREALNARRREQYAERLANPYLLRRLRQMQALQRQRMMANPESAARRRASRASYYHRVEKERRKERREQEIEERRAQYLRHREQLGLPVYGKRRINPKRVPAGPARAWLQAYAALTGLVDANTIADQLGLVGRRVQSVLYDQQAKVWLEQVDRAITTCGTFLTVDGVTVFGVDDLYPELFQMEVA